MEGAGREVGRTTNAIVDDLARQNQRSMRWHAIEQMSVSTRDGGQHCGRGAARQTGNRQGGQAAARMGNHHGRLVP